MNTTVIFWLIVLLLLVLVLSYFYSCPIVWIALIFLLIALLPTILVNADMARMIRPYLTTKKGAYAEIRADSEKFLNRHFTIKIKGQEHYDKPVIFTVNHPPLNQNIINDICLMLIKTKNKIVKFHSSASVGKLFRNIEHIYINKNEKNRTQVLKEKMKETIEEGYSVLIFPEGENCRKKTHWRQLQEFKNGTFVLAKELDIPIVPLIISGGNYHNGLVTYGRIEICYGKQIEPSEYSSIEELRDEVHLKMKEQIDEIRTGT